MLIIDHLIGPVGHAGLAGKESDSLVLAADQRRWARGRFTTTNGRAIALALPTGATLEPGAVLWVESEWYITVEAAAEPVLAVVPSDHKDALKIAFEVGNRHFPLALDGEGLLVPDDPAMVQLLNRLGAYWERRLATFDPIGAAHRHESS